jgi:cysteine-rich repeat protein
MNDALAAGQEHIMRTFNLPIFAALTSILVLTSGCSQDLAWAGDPDGGTEAGDSTGGLEPFLPGDDEGGEAEPGDADEPEPQPGPEPGVSDDDEKKPTPNPAPDPNQLGPKPAPELSCGNGIIDEGEACDDANADQSDGCLDDCTVPATCLVIKTHDPTAHDGHYVVQPPGLEPFEVYCDMTTDGGGYSFLKFDMGEAVGAVEAEQVCGDMEMQLLIPRTQAHLYASHWVALDPKIGESASLEYMDMFGIYPEFQGAACDYAPLNSESAACDWEASDEGPFWISNRIDIPEPSGYGPLAGSMAYTFGLAGDLQSYAEVAGGGAQSPVFMCDFGDKQ